MRAYGTTAQKNVSVHLFDFGLLVSTVFILIQQEHDKLQFVLFALITLRLWSERKKLKKALVALPALVVLMIFVGLSIIWSDAPGPTLEHILRFYGATAVGLFFAFKFDLKYFVEKLGLSLGAVALLSIVLVFLVPSIGIDPEDPLWRGFYEFKTQLGLGTALTVIAIAFSRPKSTLGKLFLISVGLVCLVLLVGAYSITAVIALLGLLVIMTLLTLVRRKPNLRRPLLIAAIISIPCAFVVAGNLDAVVGIFGKDTTFTGRTDIWRNVTDAISDRPLLGYGFGAFWIDGGAWEQYLPAGPNNWTPKAAHDGYLEVMVNIGIVGEILLLLFLATALRRTGLLFWRTRDLISAWPLCLILNEIITNLTEATFLCTRYFTTLDWALTVAAVVFAVQRAPVAIAKVSNANRKMQISARAISANLTRS